MEHKVQLDVLGLFASRHQESTFTLLLGELIGHRKLPIVIGLSEAQSIALAIESRKLDRPLIHDLCKEVITKLGYAVKEVTITTLKDDVFFAQVVITDGVSTLTFDAKPSDAIAIGIRFKAPLYAAEALLNEIDTIILGPAYLAAAVAESPMQSRYTQQMFQNSTDLQHYSVSLLKKLLSATVASEDYEQAALIRDELKRRELS